MDITLSIAAFALSILGIIGCIVPALPGVALSYAGLLCAWFTSYSQMTSGAIWLWLAVTVAVGARRLFPAAWMTRASADRAREPSGPRQASSPGSSSFRPWGSSSARSRAPCWANCSTTGATFRRLSSWDSGRSSHSSSARRQAGRLGRHADPCRGRHLPRSPGLVRNHFLKHIAYEKVSTTNGGHPRDARFVLQQIQVRNGVGRSAENPDLHASQRTEGLYERHEGAAPHPNGHRRAGRAARTTPPRRPVWHTTSNT